jgi:hypothetical protein
MGEIERGWEGADSLEAAGMGRADRFSPPRETPALTANASATLALG